MAADILTYEPASFIAGDTVKFTKSFGDYSAADGWTLVYELRGAGTLDVSATTDTDGIGFAVTLAAGDTQDLPPGIYQWAARASSGGEVYTVARGTLVVEANPSKALAGDLQSSTERAIANQRAKIERLTAEDNDGYSIASRAATRQKLSDAQQVLGTLYARLARENGGMAPTQLRFTNAR